MKQKDAVKVAFELAYNLARDEQIKIVHRIMNKHSYIAGYCCAMGSAFFWRKNDNRLDDEHLHIREHTNFMDEWDSIYHLSGDPIMITRGNDGILKIVFDW